MRTALVIEDHLDTREWIEELLERAYPSVSISTASTLFEANELLKQHIFCLALIDLNLPDGSGTNFCKTLATENPNTYRVVMTMYDDDYHINEAFKLGAHGYLVKDQPEERIVDALRQISLGVPPVSPGVLRNLIGQLKENDDAVPPSLPVKLSPREHEVLILISKGCQTKEIATYLDISPNTVAGYTKTLYSKLEVNSRTEATSEALRYGLVEQP